MEGVVSHVFASADKTRPGQVHDAGDRVFLCEFKNGRQVAHLQSLDKDALSDLILDEVRLPDRAAPRDEYTGFAPIQ
jgi:hypothetical protein